MYNKNKPSDSWLWIACAGFLCGLAFPIRYQTILFSAGIGLVMLMERKFKSLILFSGGVLLAIALISGYLEYQLWGYAFQKVVYYFTYNMNNAYEYTSQSWYFYLLLLLMVFIPPLSFFIVVGFARSYKKYTLIFVPTFLFLLAHSFFPNKQERFMFTVLPFFVISGTATIQEFFQSCGVKNYLKKVWELSWVFFWIVNIPLLCMFIFSYSKKARTEAMYYLHDKGPVQHIVLDYSFDKRYVQLPRFYMKHQWPEIYEYSGEKPVDEVYKELTTAHRMPQYILFLNEGNIEQRVAAWKKNFASLHRVCIAEPSLLDKIFYTLNKINVNEAIYIYKTY
ncbi:MAG: hypothetical protein RML94_16325 [Bacteroidia bacterium]|nr:hypothetical protein [Bacteroidia bacterium]